MDNREIDGRSHKYFEAYLGAYIDGELDLVRSIEVETHLKECKLCADSHQNNLTMRSAMRQDSLYFNSPPKLQGQILSSIRKQNKEKSGTVSPIWRGLALATSFALLLVLAFNLGPLFRQRPSNVSIEQEIVAGHVRSLMLASKTVDVVSSNQHVVKPWFVGKIDFTPPVKDFDDRGYILTGGRIDYIGGRSVAALVYQHQQHYINLFIWPSIETVAQSVSTNNGYNIVNWSTNGMTFWMVSDLNSTELQQLAQLIREK